MIYINDNNDVLVVDDDENYFWCPECKQSHHINDEEINETTDKTAYVVVCPNTGICVEFPKKWNKNAE